MLEAFFTGAVFGASLAVSGMYQPAVILSQMRLENFHMMQTFLAASGGSVALVNFLQKAGYLSLKPRNYSSLGLLGPLDGNIAGGFLLGIGMTLSGACPGTVFAQVGAGIQSGLYTLGGGILGGILWSGILRPALARWKTEVKGRNATTPPPKTEQLMIHGNLGISHEAAFVTVEALFSGVMALISTFGLVKTRGLFDPILSGFLISGSQLFSILSRKSLLGTSSSFEELGDYLWAILRGQSLPKSYSAMALVSGMMIGSAGLSFVVELPSILPDPALSTARLIVGGVLLSIGSRMGGGCTSGHGISGISLLSVSSFVTVAAMFAGAFATAAII
ncbi:hypothetical protein F5Y16DRAFT_227 [Xylariaceae sp. FL0255]|nr:hypothetical protein F5Y16DRAFT_227 [Xylariaceae sp. FL0255]